MEDAKTRQLSHILSDWAHLYHDTQLCEAVVLMSRGSRLRKKGCSMARRTQQQATAAWRLLYRLLFMVTRRLGEVVTLYDLILVVF